MTQHKGAELRVDDLYARLNALLIECDAAGVVDLPELLGRRYSTEPATVARLSLVIECVTCGRPIASGSQAWRCCPEHHDKYGPGEWECADCVGETHMRMAL